MKQVYTYQEIAPIIEQGKRVLFTCYPEMRVSIRQNHQESETVTVTLNLSIRDTCIGIIEYEYASLLAVLDAFDIDERSEIWEVFVGGSVFGKGQKRQEKE